MVSLVFIYLLVKVCQVPLMGRPSQSKILKEKKLKTYKYFFVSGVSAKRTFLSVDQKFNIQLYVSLLFACHL